MRNLKYPLALFLFLLVAKLGYIIVESYYNYDVLTTTTSSELSQRAIEDLNERGHLIASFGITLLLIPFFYFFVKRKKQLALIISLSIFSTISFTGIYHSLNYLVDYIVEKNQDKRYEAYYSNLLKYGIINGVIYYNSFIPKEQIKELSVNNKILLSNIFLLSASDPDLINKFREKGEKNTIDLYLQKYRKDDFEKSFSAFKETYQEIENSWIEFNEEKKELAKQLTDLGDEKAIKEAFEKMHEQLSENYKKYQKAYANLDTLMREKTGLKDLREIKQSLDKFFRYRNNSRAKQKYKERMQDEFGSYIEPEAWLNKQGEVTYPSIIQVIKQQIERKVKEKAYNLPSGLNKQDFLQQKTIKIEVARALKAKGILIPANFDYSYEQFKTYHALMRNKVYEEIETKFTKAMETRIGKNDLTLATDWRGYIYSNYLKNKIFEKIGANNQNDLKLYQQVFLSRNLNNFRSMIYMPKAMEFATENIIHEQADFLKKPKIAKKGNQAIKLLYIPPIALGLSIIALLLNIVTVIGMLLKLTPLHSFIQSMLVLFLALSIVMIPLAYKSDNLQNRMLSRKTNPNLLNTLQWASFWERVNYLLHARKSN